MVIKGLINESRGKGLGFESETKSEGSGRRTEQTTDGDGGNIYLLSAEMILNP